MSNHISVATDGAIMIVGIDRPSKRNALNEPMFDALARAFHDAASAEHISVLLIHGDEQCFSAGHDLDAFGQLWPQPPDGAIVRFMEALVSIGKPVVAAVNGPAVGLGATMLLSADYVVAGQSSSFRFPFAELGIAPEAGSSALLARRVGDLCARDWLLSARKIPASEALDKGLISIVEEDVRVYDTAFRYAQMLSQRSSEVLGRIRRLIDEGFNRSAPQALAAEVELLNHLIPKLVQTSQSH